MNMHSLIDLVRQLRDGSLGSRELVTDTLQRIDAQAGLNAFVSIDAERALAEAERADNRPATDRGPLHGVPIALKDIFCRQNSRTTAGSRMLEHWVAPYDATVVERLEAAGAVLVGKTNMDEFAMGSSGENSFFGATRNPWHQNHVPGGSSSGSAAAVAAGTVPAAIGTDTGGSIRQPAAFCGLTGLKPTYGRVSRWGMIAFASSLDQAGPMAWNAEDAALLMHVMAGFDERDSTSLDVPGEDYSATLNTPVKGLRLGIPAAFLGDAVDPEIRAALEAACNEYRALGVELVEIDLPHALEGVAAYYVIAPAEASANLARFDGVRYGYRCEAPQSLEDLYLRSRGEGFGAEVKRRILTGTYALSIGYYDAYYRRAQRIRRLIRDDFLTAFESVDAILTPTTPSVAFRLGEKVADPVTMYQQDLFTIPANLAGIPALSMPAGFSEGLPIGVQLMGPHFSEARLLQLAHAFQQVSNHHLQQPEGGAGA